MVNYFKGLFLVTVFLVSAQAMSSNIESADADAVELQKGQSNVLIEWIEPKNSAMLDIQQCPENVIESRYYLN
jgi:hypothetical protein